MPGEEAVRQGKGTEAEMQGGGSLPGSALKYLRTLSLTPSTCTQRQVP